MVPSRATSVRWNDADTTDRERDEHNPRHLAATQEATAFRKRSTEHRQATFPDGRRGASASRAAQVSWSDLVPTTPASDAVPHGKRRAVLPGTVHDNPDSWRAPLHICGTISEEDEHSSDDEPEVKRVISGQLWSKAEFPCGMRAPSVWEMSNLLAAQQWMCPCAKSGARSCLGPSRVDVVQLYQHREAFHARASTSLRAALRADLQAHHDIANKTFRRTFKVGPHIDCCEAAYALACGVSFTTFARARADVTLQRPDHVRRQKQRDLRKEEARKQVLGYINSLKRRLEGSKGGTYANGETKFYTAKKRGAQRYADYVAQMNRDGVPVRCSTVREFMRVWDSDKTLLEVSATGHAKCDECSSFEARRAALGGRNDEAAVRMRREIEEDEREHARVHLAPRDVFDKAVYDAEHYADLVTCINIDAPTRRQFDLPRIPRARDTPKGLEGAKRWESKVTGAMDAGLGTRVFIAHESVGGGPNLVATVLYLTLLAHVRSGRPLGDKLVVQLDNTCGENKCITIIAVVAWLVLELSFKEALINCMPVGHTFTLLDQSFNTLIDGMHTTSLPTVEEMCAEVYRRMREYQCLEVTELPAVFDFTSWFKPVVHKLEGFARREALGGMYTGMGQFLFQRGAERGVFLKMRVSPLATSWIPEGEGYKVFKDVSLDAECGPPYAPLKSFAAWQMDSVVATIRRWMPFMGMDPGTQAKAKQQWEDRLANLTQTVDGITRGLPDWQGPPCPQVSPTAAQGIAAAPRPWIGVCDNPPVNPVEYNNERHYRRDVERWQEATRTQAAQASAPPPVHLSDYLILTGRKPADPPMLVRTTAGTFGVTGGEIDLIATVYTHKPSEQVPGWGWGTFAPQANAAFDPADRSKGGRHIMMQSITRADVLVYNARTFLDSDRALRMHLDSMKELANAAPTLHPLPDPLPQSHRRCPEGAPATYVEAAQRNDTTNAGACGAGNHAQEEAGDGEEEHEDHSEAGDQEGTYEVEYLMGRDAHCHRARGCT